MNHGALGARSFTWMKLTTSMIVMHEAPYLFRERALEVLRLRGMESRRSTTWRVWFAVQMYENFLQISISSTNCNFVSSDSLKAHSISFNRAHRKYETGFPRRFTFSFLSNFLYRASFVVEEHFLEKPKKPLWIWLRMMWCFETLHAPKVSQILDGLLWIFLASFFVIRGTCDRDEGYTQTFVMNLFFTPAMPDAEKSMFTASFHFISHSYCRTGSGASVDLYQPGDQNMMLSIRDGCLSELSLLFGGMSSNHHHTSPV